jgi:uncharacterized protein YecE (DUF72 family)
MQNNKYFVGTAGWSYKDWAPSFYPKNQSGSFDWLQFYSHYFNCVEVNSTYYTYISPKVVQGWLNKVSDVDDFLFTVKLHQDFTHKKNYNQQNIKDVSQNLQILSEGERLGGLLFQFPYSFAYNDSNVKYVKELKDIFQNYICFIEVRHKSWNNWDAYNLFNQQNLIYTSIDQPQIGQSLHFKPVVINGIGYIRFHGRNKEAWLKSIQNFGKKQTYDQRNERYDYLYSPGEIVEIIQLIKPLLDKVKELFIILNNHPKGNAVVNAFQFMNHFESKKVVIPVNTLKSFPQLSDIAE